MTWSLDRSDGLWLAGYGVERAKPGGPWQPTPNLGGAFAPGLPDTVILHFTACGTLAGAVRALTDPHPDDSARRVSAHLVVSRDGDVVQLASLDRIAWHAGASRWQERERMNRYAIGIEIVNWGRLEQVVGGRLSTWTGASYPPEEAVRRTHRNELAPSWWATYTSAQLETVEALCVLLRDELGCRTILGHEEVSPGRKSDPGPAWPLDDLRRSLLGPPWGTQEPVAAASGPEDRPGLAGRLSAALGRVLAAILRWLPGVERVY